MAKKDSDEGDLFGICGYIKRKLSDVVHGSGDIEMEPDVEMAADEGTKVDKKIKSDDNCYDFNHSKRGIAVVIVNEKFEGHSKRSGAEKDRDMLRDCFRALNFDVRVFTNLNGFEMMIQLERIADEMNEDTDFDCFMFAMSSHGDKVEEKKKNVTIVEDVIHATDGYVHTRQILDIFSDENCTGLIGKPRLFFLQACRGDKFDKGADMLDVVDGHNDDIVITPVPCQKDYLVMYATPPGFYAFRRPSHGSWFVIELCRILSLANGEKANICKLLRWVTKCVGYEYESGSNDYRFNAKKQSSVFYSMLVKDVLFS